MKPILISLSDSNPLIESICQKCNFEYREVTVHKYPDKEVLVQLPGEYQDRKVVVLQTLDEPNAKILPLIFLAETARSLGAKQVGLCAPYLAYMRQDKVFHQGEGVTSAYFAKLLSSYFDWLVTVDPHLHRFHSLSEIYSIPSKVVSSTPSLSKWISENIQKPLLVGPDIESKQWLEKISQQTSAPFVVFEKRRHDDHHVEMVAPNLSQFKNHTPVLIDDIASSGRTLMKAIDKIHEAIQTAVTCVVVHPIFAEQAYQTLKDMSQKLASTNSIQHESNEIDLTDTLIDPISHFVGSI